MAQLTKNFSLEEFLVSQTARRRGIDMTPDSQVIANLTRLCCEVLQPLRDNLGEPIIITSGYRPPALNQAIGGSRTSQHVFGLAADLVVPGLSVKEVYDEIRALRLTYDQLIDEFSSWVHVSVNLPGEEIRAHNLVAVRENGSVVYRFA